MSGSEREPFRVLSLFSGIGGIDLGLERTGGFKTVAFSEVDPFCKWVLKKHWPGVPIFPDVRKIKGEWFEEGEIEVIAGGFPCQPHSVAGKRRGIEDERHLWPEFARLVRELRPRWVLAENVPGIRTTAADEVIGDLEEAGYRVWACVVGAGDVGAPHRRKRVWFVAHLSSAQAGRDRQPVLGANEPGLSAAAIGRGVGHAQHDDGRADEPGRGAEGRATARRAGASERLAKSDAGGGGAKDRDASHEGRRTPARGAAVSERRGTPVGDAGSSSGDRAADSAVGQADRHGRGRQGKRYTCRDARSPIHGQSFGNLADGRGERPVGEPNGARGPAGLSGQERPHEEGHSEEPHHAGCRQELPQSEGERRAQQGDGRDAGSRLGCGGPRWPARPGEPQWEWEEPRLVEYANRGRSEAGSESRNAGNAGTLGDGEQYRESAGRRTAREVEGSPQLPLGGSVDGLPERLARRANRESLKALGNSVVPQVVHAIGQAILETEWALCQIGE